jgi:large subunit ribosomal protein L21
VGPPVVLKHPMGQPSKSLPIFAIFECSGTQFKVLQGDVIMTEKLPGKDIEQTVVFDKVVLLGSRDWTLLGRPLVQHAKVHAVIEEQSHLKKIIVFKKKRRKGYKKTQGHRAEVTVLKVVKIETPEDLRERLEHAVPVEPSKSRHVQKKSNAQGNEKDLSGSTKRNNKASKSQKKMELAPQTNAKPDKKFKANKKDSEIPAHAKIKIERKHDQKAELMESPSKESQAQDAPKKLLLQITPHVPRRAKTPRTTGIPPHLLGLI